MKHTEELGVSIYVLQGGGGGLLRTTFFARQTWYTGGISRRLLLAGYRDLDGV